MRFVETLGLSGMQTVVRLFLGLLSVKFVATTFGPDGLGLIAQVGTLITLCGGVLANGASTAIVNLVPGMRKNSVSLKQLVSNSIWVVVGSGVLVCLVALFANPIGEIVLGSTSHLVVVLVALATVPLFVAASLMQGWLTAFEHIRPYYFGQIACALLGFVVLSAAVSTKNLDSALIATAIAYSLPAVWFGFWWRKQIRRSSALRETTWLQVDSLKQIGTISRFYPMLLVHSIAMPLTLLLVRWYQVKSSGADQMGAWQAGWRLSELYVGILTMAAATYFAPKLALNVDSPQAFWAVARRLLISVCGGVVVVALTLYLTRQWVVPLIFSREFGQTVSSLPIQLLSDVPRAFHWCVGLILVARISRKTYIGLELLVMCLIGLGIVFLGDLMQQAIGVAFLFAFTASAFGGAVVLMILARKDGVLWRI